MNQDNEEPGTQRGHQDDAPEPAGPVHPLGAPASGPEPAPFDTAGSTFGGNGAARPTRR